MGLVATLCVGLLVGLVLPDPTMRWALLKGICFCGCAYVFWKGYSFLKKGGANKIKKRLSGLFSSTKKKNE